MKDRVMRAVGVIPARREVRLLEHPAPALTAPTQVRVRTLEVGICGTDREICRFEYGEPPAGAEALVLGHEALGEVIETGPAVTRFQAGDLVVPTIRRPCPHPSCGPCRAGRLDFCGTGDFLERGIKMAHGFLTECFVEEEEYLNRAPAGLRQVAVLAEPLTVAEKTLQQVWQVQARLPWGNPASTPEARGAGLTAVVLGAGPVGILGAMALLVNGFRTFVYSRSPTPNPKSSLIDSLGARYVSSETVPVAALAEEVGNIDLVYEAVGVGRISFDLLKHLGPNGIFVFTGIPPCLPAIPIEADTLMRQMVLKNQVALGTVNAAPADFEAALRDLEVFQARWPAALPTLITGRHPIEHYHELLLGPNRGIKNVIAFGSS